MTQRRRDADPKTKKHVSLTPHAVAVIGDWATAQDVSFSAAIEGLALVGLEDDLSNSLVPMLLSMMSRIVNRTYNRFAKLMAYAAIEAGAANRMTSAMMLQLIREYAEADPAGFSERMKVSREGDGTAQQIRALHKNIRTQTRLDAVHRLKKPLTEIEEILRADPYGEEESEQHSHPEILQK